MNPFVVCIVLECLLCSVSATPFEKPKVRTKMPPNSNNVQTVYSNFLNNRLSGNENDETVIKAHNLNSVVDENIQNSPKFESEKIISPVSQVDKLVKNLINKSNVQNAARINANVSIISSPEYRKLLDISDRLEKASNYENLNEYAGRNELDRKYLKYNSYTNEDDSNEDIDQNNPYGMSEQPSIENPDFRNDEEREETLLQRMIKSSKKLMCSFFIFVKCSEEPTHKDVEDLGSQIHERGEEEPVYEKVESPTVIVQETCPLGKYVLELNLCLFFVMKESKFSEAKEACDSLVEGAELWVSDTDAWSAAAILEENEVVKGDYSAWVDGVFFEDTLVGTGHFDSKYKKWLDLGTVRGKRKNKDNIVLNQKKDDIFYSYDEGRNLHQFVCQCHPLDYEHLVWNEKHYMQQYLPYEI